MPLSTEKWPYLVAKSPRIIKKHNQYNFGPEIRLTIPLCGAKLATIDSGYNLESKMIFRKMFEQGGAGNEGDAESYL